MRKVIKIVVLILVYLFFCGKSCQDDQDLVMRQVKEVETLKDSLRTEFSADYLSEESKYAAEMAAIQKISDLADYIEIYTDVSLDTVFKEKAGEMIREIFISEDARLSFGPYRNKKTKFLTVEKFLDKGFGDDVILAEVLYDSIVMDIPLTRSRPGYYEGTITGVQKITYFTRSDTTSSDKAMMAVTVQASRKIKIFGKDTLNIWAVNLADMTLIKLCGN